MKMLNKTQVAEFLGMSKSNLEKRMWDIPHYKRIGNTVVIHGNPFTVDKSIGNERVVFLESEILEYLKTI